MPPPETPIQETTEQQPGSGREEEISEEDVQTIIRSMKHGHIRFYHSLFNQNPPQNSADDQISVLGPAMYMIHKLFNGPSSAAPEPEGPRERNDPKERPSVDNLESELMREKVDELWTRKDIVPRTEEMSLLYNRVKNRGLLRKRRDYLLVNVMEEILSEQTPPVPFPIMFSNAKTFQSRTWNKAVAAYIVRDHLISRFNDRIEIDGYHRRWSDKKWVLLTMSRVTKHAEYEYGRASLLSDPNKHDEHKNKSRAAEARSRQFDRRLKAARNHGLDRQVRAMKLLGDEGMSSDEEIDGEGNHIRAIHAHSWRSQSATKMVWYLERLATQDERGKPRRGNIRNSRQDRAGPTQNPRNSRRWREQDMYVPSHLPENYYNLQLLAERSQFHWNGLSAKEILRATPATDDLDVPPPHQA